MKQLRTTWAVAVMAVGVIGCETRTDNDFDRADRTTSTRIDSGTVTNDRMNTGNPNDRATGRMSTGGTSTGGTITTDNSGLDRTGTGAGIGTGTGTGTGTGAGAGGTSGAGGAGTGR